MISHRSNGAVIVIELSKAITVEELEAEIALLLANNKKRIAMDLSGLHFTESTDLAILMVAYKLCLERGGELVVYGLQAYAQRLMQITKLDKVLKIFKSEEEATEFLNRTPNFSNLTNLRSVVNE